MLIEARNLTKVFGNRTALAGIDLVIPDGQHIAVTGPSGVGKSTLLRLLSGLAQPTAGQVRLDGMNLADFTKNDLLRLRRTELGFVFQTGQLIPELKVIENVSLPLLLQGRGRHAARSAARTELGKLGLEHLTNSATGSLSQGEWQLVAIARALVHRPKVIFADEPTAALDRVSGQEAMQALTIAASSKGSSLVVVTHDLAITSWCDRVIELRDGLIVHDSLQKEP